MTTKYVIVAQSWGGEDYYFNVKTGSFDLSDNADVFGSDDYNATGMNLDAAKSANKEMGGKMRSIQVEEIQA